MIDLILRVSLVALQAAQLAALALVVRRLKPSGVQANAPESAIKAESDPIDVLGHEIKQQIWQASNWSGATH